MSEQVDPAVVRRVMQGDRAALADVLESQQQRLYNIILRMVHHRDDAAELTQEALLKVVQHIGDYTGRAAITTWMIRIAMNLAISHLRKAGRRGAVSLDAEMGGDDLPVTFGQNLPDGREPGPAASVENREMVGHLFAALGRLEDDHRAVVVLRDLGEMDYQEIASVLGVAVGTVKSRLFRARLALRESMYVLYPRSGEAMTEPDGTQAAPAGEGSEP